MEIKRILFATKFGEVAFDALLSLFDLKRTGLEEIVLTHIIPRDEVAFVPFGGYLKEEEEKQRESARLRFEDWQRALESAGLQSKIRIEVGDPVPKIIRIAEEERVSLIVAGRKKRAAWERLYAGSRTLDLMRHGSKIPLLISKYMVYCDMEGDCIKRVNEHPFQRPLVALDWGSASERALHLASHAKGVIERADIVHAIDLRSYQMKKEEFGRVETENRAKLKSSCRRLTDLGIRCESHLVAGEPGDEIIRLSREINSTMCIMGTTGKNFMQAILLGSTSQYVAERSEVPTLLIP